MAAISGRTNLKRSHTTSIIWEIAMTPSGYEILRDGVSVRAVDGSLEEARSALDELMAAMAVAALPASATCAAGA